jgi:hypothetical protein
MSTASSNDRLHKSRFHFYSIKRHDYIRSFAVIYIVNEKQSHILFEV